jgi:mono/diheme cytochrome c family protein
MKISTLRAVMMIGCFTAGCQSGGNNAAPAVTPALTRFITGSGMTMANLERGRFLFASRCAECHVLPAIRSYPEDRWPKIVNWMGDRAGLKPPDRDAMIAYILGAHRQLNASH